MQVGDTFVIKNILDEVKTVLLLYKYDLHNELDVQKYIKDYISTRDPGANPETYEKFLKEQEIPIIKKRYNGASWLYLSGDEKFLSTEEALLIHRGVYDMMGL